MYWQNVGMSCPYYRQEGQRDNPEAVWAKGKIEELVVCAENWATPSPSGLSMMLIYMKELPNVPNGYNRVVIRSDHPAYNSALQLAIAAKTNGIPVALCYLKSTKVRNNSWDFAQLSIQT